MKFLCTLSFLSLVTGPNAQAVSASPRAVVAHLHHEAFGHPEISEEPSYSPNGIKTNATLKSEDKSEGQVLKHLRHKTEPEPETEVKSLEVEHVEAEGKKEEGPKEEEGGSEAEEEGEKEEGKKEEEKEEAENRVVGRVSAGLIFCSTILGAMVFAMTQSGDLSTRYMTWFTIQNVAAIYIAVLWYQAIDDLMDVIWSPGHWKVIAAFVHALLLFAGILVLAFALKAREGAFWGLLACGGHYVAFGALHAGNELQAHFFSATPLQCVLCLCLLIVVFMLAGYVAHLIIDSKFDAEMREQLEDLQSDAGGMTLAFLWTLTVRFLICGHYPEMEQGEGEDEPSPKHTPTMRTIMGLYALGFFVLGMVLLPNLEGIIKRPHSKLVQRLLSLIEPFTTMSIAWGILLWADWTMYESLYRGQEVLGRMLFAVCASVLAICAVKLAAIERFKGASGRRHSFLCMLTLVVGFAWEETFDAALEGASEGIAHPLFFKFGCAFATVGAVAPVFIAYIRPIVQRLQQEDAKGLEGK